MQEGDELAGGARAGLGVDQLHAGTGGLLQLAGEVGRGERHVMQALAVFLDELRHGAVRRRGFEQLEVDFTHRKKGRPTFCAGTSSRRSHFKPSACS